MNYLRQSIERIKGLALAMSRPQLMALAALTLTGLISMGWLLAWSMQSKWEPLNYKPFEGSLQGDVLEKLDSMQVKYELRNGLVMVAADSRNKILMQLGRDKKLSMHGKDFWKWMFEPDWTSTDMKTREKILRTNEARLRAVIRKWPRIADARIVITPGDQNDTFEMEKPAKASVMLALKGSDPLPQPSVVSIAHMISGAVRGLEPHNVKVSDGHRLYRVPKPDSAEEVLSGYLAMKRRYNEQETAMIRRALGPVGGASHIALELEIDRKSKISEKKGVPIGSPPSHELKKSEDKSSIKPRGGTPGVSINAENQGAQSGAATQRETRKTSEIWRKNQQQNYEKVIEPPGKVMVKRVSINIPYRLAGRAQSGEIAADTAAAEKNITVNIARWKKSVMALGYKAEEVVITTDAELTMGEPLTSGISNQVLTFARDHGAQMFLGLILFVALMSVARNLRKSVPDSLDDLLRADMENLDAQIKDLLEGQVPPKFDERSAGLRDRIQDLIRENPQGAALFIGRWVKRE